MPVETRSYVDQEIRALVDGFAKAVREKNLDALMPHYAPELVVFNVVPPLRDKGIEANRKGWREWFDSFKGGINYEVRELTVVGNDDVAFSHSLNVALHAVIAGLVTTLALRWLAPSAALAAGC